MRTTGAGAWGHPPPTQDPAAAHLPTVAAEEAANAQLRLPMAAGELV